jgi:thiol-disulfide isomerase/thioredoxin
MTVRRAVLALAALLLAGAGGCGTPAPPQARAPGGATATFAFTGRTLDGRPYDASVLAGRPALLWFWAPWCATCASQAGAVTDMQATHGDRLGILGIAGLGGNAEMHEFVADMEVGTVTNLDDAAGTLWKRFGITEQSTYVLVDRAGSVVGTGYLDHQELTARVASLVG